MVESPINTIFFGEGKAPNGNPCTIVLWPNSNNERATSLGTHYFSTYGYDISILRDHFAKRSDQDTRFVKEVPFIDLTDLGSVKRLLAPKTYRFTLRRKRR